MSSIHEVLLQSEKGDLLYSILDKVQEEKADALKLTVADLVNSDAQQNEKITALESASGKLSEADAAVETELKDHDERITKAQSTADSNAQKHSALSLVVESNTKKITDEIERATEIEGVLDQLETTDKANLVAAINWVLTKADKALENVGTLNDLTTEEKTDIVLAINEVLKTVEANKTSGDEATSAVSKALEAYKTSNDKAVADTNEALDAYKTSNDKAVAAVNDALVDQVGNVKLLITADGLLHIEEKEA